MATLAQVTSETRLTLKILAGIFTVLTLVFLFFKGGEIFKNLFFPTPPPPPDEKFGKLPEIIFPAQQPTNYSFEINTISGKLPAFPDRMKTYKVKETPPTLSALQNTRNKMKNAGFSERETKLSDTKYQWGNRTGEIIIYDTETNNFWIKSNYLNNVDSLGYPALKKDDSLRLTKSFLDYIRGDMEDLDLERSTLTYYKILNGALVKAESQNEANVARLDLFQKELERGLKIYYPETDKSIMYFVFAYRGGMAQIVEGQYLHFPANTESIATYGIKNSQEAFEDLKNGNSFIAKGDIKAGGYMGITDVSLGYFAGEENQKYLLPIVIFEGNNFAAYVSAIRESGQIQAPPDIQ